MSNESNPFALAAAEGNAAVQVAQTKAAQEIQAALVVAKKFPRDQHASFQRIIEACKRRSLAEEATYLYSRGGQQITGASIRLLEVVAQGWGNVQSGVVELENENGESRVQSFAWDLETNTYDSKIFTVRHERHLKNGEVVKLDDPRDQYELVANFAARRKRACLEAIIPRDIIDSAIEQCERTLKSGHTEPLTDRVRKMATAFAEHGVSVDMIERKLQHKLDACIEQELVILRKIYTSLKDGMGKREDFFDVTDAPKPAQFKQASMAQVPPAQQAAAATAAKPAAATPAAASPAAQAAAATAPRRGRPPGPRTAAPAPAPAPAQESEPAPAGEGEAGEPGDGDYGPQEGTQEQQPGEAQPEGQAEGQGEAQATSPADLFADPNSLVSQAYAVLNREKITEEEVLAVYKFRGVAKKDTEQLVQLPDHVLTDLINTAQMMAAQVRINRRAAANK